MPDVEVVELPSQRVVGMRTSTSLRRIGDDIGGLAVAVAQALGPAAAGPCVTRYVTWEGDAGDIVVGFPSAAEPPPGCLVEELPEGRAAVYLHVGPYDQLAGAWAAAREAIERAGLTCGDAPWEEYLDDCSATPADRLRTRIVWPLA